MRQPVFIHCTCARRLVPGRKIWNYVWRCFLYSGRPDTLDWKVQNTEKIVRTVQEQIEDGAIILMHDEYDTSVEAALQVVDELKNQGYELVTVDQLILP